MGILHVHQLKRYPASKRSAVLTHPTPQLGKKEDHVFWTNVDESLDIKAFSAV
jgi:hypothetical protein